MADVLEIATAHRDYGVAVAANTAAELQVLWQGIDKDRILASWMQRTVPATEALSRAQGAVVTDSLAYAGAAMQVQSVPLAGPTVDASPLVGLASDGRQLGALMQMPAFTALVGIKSGQSVDEALAGGFLQLLRIVQTQLADASRVAEGLVMSSRSRPAGYIRMVRPGACSRCIILAGKWYRAGTAFARHPFCHCRHIPAMENDAGDWLTDPYEHFHALSPAEQVAKFGEAGAAAINDGADIFQVVNARRGMSTTAGGSVVTREGTTRRGYWGSQQLQRDRVPVDGERYGVSIRARMMPEEIYRRAKGNPDAARRLLTEYGYLIGAQDPAGAIRGPGYGFSSRIRKGFASDYLSETQARRNALP
ncbi:hypothetical protein [Arthrobacter woluwensis]|uniref:hypothetical protein n=1 Tax=Arthrobacter woluwensis TaxID=156980 RepID=UPI00119D7FBC|nr:hypothetical protein [Arthrobacter woluwensis]